MKQISTIGIDIAKHIFQIHGISDDGTVVVRRKLRRSEMLTYFEKLSPCLIGMEACGSSHYWARELAKFGHDVRLMSPSYVKPYVKRQKNDAADAEAICEAVGRPNMRFVSVKSEDQQGMLMLHRARDLLVRQKTALINALRGHLAEFGIVARLGIMGVRELKAVIEDERVKLSHPARLALRALAHQLGDLEERIRDLDKEILALHEADETSRNLATIPGIGPLTASALTATITDIRAFQSARQLSAFLGLVPRQNSSGGKERLGHITKAGDGYIRRLLVIGATAVLRFGKKGTTGLARWAVSLLDKKPFKVVAVALANKIARLVWVLMTRGECFRGSSVGF